MTDIWSTLQTIATTVAGTAVGGAIAIAGQQQLWKLNEKSKDKDREREETSRKEAEAASERARVLQLYQVVYPEKVKAAIELLNKIILTTPSNKIAVAIEHENNFPGSGDEIRKLKKLDAPLGVLITYIGRQRQRMISEYTEIMSTGQTPTCSNSLLIIGPYGMKTPTNLIWDYYAYDGNQYKPPE